MVGSLLIALVLWALAERRRQGNGDSRQEAGAEAEV
jgi:hypothetical protein